MKNFLFVFNLLAVIVVCLAGAAFFAFERPQEVSDFVLGTNGRVLFTLVFLLILVLNIVGIVALGFGERERMIRFTNKEGTITVSIKAVEEALTIAACSLPEVDKISVTLSKRDAHDDSMEFTGEVVAFDYPNVREISEKIQTVMKARLEEILQESEKVSFNVDIDRFSSRKSGGRTARVAPPSGRIAEAGSKEAPPSKPRKDVEPPESIAGGEFPIKYPIGDSNSK